MTADLINLNRARKAKAKAGKEVRAAENRAKFGRTKLERETSLHDEALAKAKHDGHFRDAGTDGSPDAVQPGPRPDPDGEGT